MSKNQKWLMVRVENKSPPSRLANFLEGQCITQPIFSLGERASLRLTIAEGPHIGQDLIMKKMGKTIEDSMTAAAKNTDDTLRINGIHLGLFYEQKVENGLLKGKLSRHYLNDFLTRQMKNGLDKNGYDVNFSHFKSQVTIAEELDWSKSSVYRTERALCEAGILVKDKKPDEVSPFKHSRIIGLSEASKNEIVKLASHFNEKRKNPNDSRCSQGEYSNTANRAQEESPSPYLDKKSGKTLMIPDVVSETMDSKAALAANRAQEKSPSPYVDKGKSERRTPRKKGTSEATEICRLLRLTGIPRRDGSHQYDFKVFVAMIDVLINLAGGGNKKAGYDKVIKVAGMTFKDFEKNYDHFKDCYTNGRDPFEESEARLEKGKTIAYLLRLTDCDKTQNDIKRALEGKKGHEYTKTWLWIRNRLMGLREA